MSGLEKVLDCPEMTAIAASRADAIRESFMPMANMVGLFEERYAAIMQDAGAGITKQVMASARRLRLDIAKVRTETERVRKAEKEESLRCGKAIDGVANILKWAIMEKEKRLQEIEDTAERMEKARLDHIRAQRMELVEPYLDGESVAHDLASLADDVWEAYLSLKKQRHQERLEAEALAKARAEEKARAEAEERERIRQENARLKAEAEERERLAKEERRKAEEERRKAEEAANAEIRRLEEQARKEREAAELTLRIEKERAEEAARLVREAADAERRRLEEQAQKEREAAEAEKKRVEEKARLDREAAEAKIRAIEEQVRADAERRSMIASMTVVDVADALRAVGSRSGLDSLIMAIKLSGMVEEKEVGIVELIKNVFEGGVK